MIFLRSTGEKESAPLRVGLPMRIEDESWYCPYELRTDSRKKAFAMHGVDAL